MSATLHDTGIPQIALNTTAGAAEYLSYRTVALKSPVKAVFPGADGALHVLVSQPPGPWTIVRVQL